ncbi:hypothetical protein P4O66_018168 [Electrophorus voltai]|uniref:Uncharacterized protein n=1 Tax=Electrophorus voltai TaxID=2609070 RepID=A0AAD8YSD3_9TELE|nr:hypothetical protein P4O66_018168 [Electrophorus voltai]
MRRTLVVLMRKEHKAGGCGSVLDSNCTRDRRSCGEGAGHGEGLEEQGEGAGHGEGSEELRGGGGARGGIGGAGGGVTRTVVCGQELRRVPFGPVQMKAAETCRCFTTAVRMRQGSSTEEALYAGGALQERKLQLQLKSTSLFPLCIPSLPGPELFRCRPPCGVHLPYGYRPPSYPTSPHDVRFGSFLFTDFSALPRVRENGSRKETQGTGFSGVVGLRGAGSALFAVSLTIDIRKRAQSPSWQASDHPDPCWPGGGGRGGACLQSVST